MKSTIHAVNTAPCKCTSGVGTGGPSNADRR
jgi:hypothetical protein